MTDWTIAEAARRIAARQLSPVELTTELLGKVELYLPPEQVERIREAAEFGAQAHQGQTARLELLARVEQHQRLLGAGAKVVRLGLHLELTTEGPVELPKQRRTGVIVGVGAHHQEISGGIEQGGSGSS